jgi:hypothetical protein
VQGTERVSKTAEVGSIPTTYAKTTRTNMNIRKLEWKGTRLGPECVWPVEATQKAWHGFTYVACGAASTRKLEWDEGTIWHVCERHYDYLMQIEHRRELSLEALDAKS